MEIHKRDIIEIKKDKFDALKVMREVDAYDFTNKKIIGPHIAIELHKLGSRALHPTHLLKIYPDKSKATMFKIVQERPPKELEKLKQRGHILAFVEEKKIPIRDIKIL
ncbi:MAG: hypothetical protein ACOYT4_03150 [Nanoarchaeota archaeon]